MQGWKFTHYAGVAKKLKTTLFTVNYTLKWSSYPTNVLRIVHQDGTNHVSEIDLSKQPLARKAPETSKIFFVQRMQKATKVTLLFVRINIMCESCVKLLVETSMLRETLDDGLLRTC